MIYHYCSLETFKNIIYNREIWLSDIKKMNDTSEANEVYNILQKSYFEILEKILILEEKEYKNSLVTEITEKLKKDFPDKKYKNIIGEINKIKLKKDSNELTRLREDSGRILGILIFRNENQKINKYISCFSKQGDILSQWRNYANDAKGISLGFSQEKMKAILNKINTNNKNISFELETVKYISNEEKEYKKILEKIEFINKEIEKEYIKLCSDLSSFILRDLYKEIKIINLEEGMNETNKQNIISFLKEQTIEIIATMTAESLNLKNMGEGFKKGIINFFKTSAFFKNSYFLEEDEIRILLIENEENEINEGTEENQTKVSNINYRIKSENTFIKYRKIVFSFEDFINVINKVYIGPKCNIAKEEMEKFLEKNGMKNIEVIKSTIPYN